MSGHEHGKHCYWDYREARWVCRPEPAEPDLAGNFPAVVVSIDDPVVAVADGA